MNNIVSPIHITVMWKKGKNTFYNKVPLVNINIYLFIYSIY